MAPADLGALTKEGDAFSLAQRGGNRVREAQRAQGAMPSSGAAQMAAGARLVATPHRFDGLRQIEFSIAITVRADETEIRTGWRMEDRHLR